MITMNTTSPFAGPSKGITLDHVWGLELNRSDPITPYRFNVVAPDDRVFSGCAATEQQARDRVDHAIEESIGVCAACQYDQHSCPTHGSVAVHGAA